MEEFPIYDVTFDYNDRILILEGKLFMYHFKCDNGYLIANGRSLIEARKNLKGRKFEYKFSHIEEYGEVYYLTRRVDIILTYGITIRLYMRGSNCSLNYYRKIDRSKRISRSS